MLECLVPVDRFQCTEYPRASLLSPEQIERNGVEGWDPLTACSSKRKIYFELGRGVPENGWVGMSNQDVKIKELLGCERT
jgi:hypothetical protein